MAALVSLVASAQGWRKVCLVFGGTGKGLAASWAGTSGRQKYSSQCEQVSSKADVPVSMENPYKEPPKKCILCGLTLDYKNVQLLSQFVSPYTGHIFGRHITGLCGKKQRELSKTIKRAHKMGFMSVTYKDPTFLKDPKICNIKYPE